LSRQRRKINLDVLKAKQDQIIIPQVDKGKTVFDFSSYDGEIKWFKPRASENGQTVINRIDILQFVVTTDKHPNVKDFPIDSVDFGIPISTHRDIGTENKSFICLKGTYGKHCPICQEQQRLYNIGDVENAKRLNASHRVLYCVKDINTGEICLYNASVKTFAEPMKKQFDLSYPKDGPIPFIADLEDGRTIEFTANMEKMGNGHSYPKPDAFQFKERVEPYTDDILDQTYPLDSFLIVHTAEEMEAVLFGHTEEDKKEENKVEETTKVEKTSIAEEPRKPKREAIKENIVCPDGYIFGEDFDQDDCSSDCTHIEKCKELTEKE
jgi:hypothetical protein